MMKTAKEQFLDAFEPEHGRTMRLLRAYPDEQSDFKPHERSRTAREVAWPLVLGVDRLMVKAATTGFDWSQPPSPPPAMPAKMSEIVAAADAGYKNAVEAIRSAPDTRFDETVQFFVAPKKLDDIPVRDFLWFLLFDHIHHRGQLSVYVRMVGKVPSVYGPSGDEPWK